MASDLGEDAVNKVNEWIVNSGNIDSEDTGDHGDDDAAGNPLV
jgi:hypothetical protein